MPSFDIVSEIDSHELRNAIDQTNREVSNRFDFKGSNSRVESSDNSLTIITPSEFQVKQVYEILQTKMSKRGIDLLCLAPGNITESNNEARQIIEIKQGIDKDTARKIIKLIKNLKIKVQTSIQGAQVRVSGKKRDDLQEVISLVKKSEIELPIQCTNFRD